jgi:exoribonuclease R
MASVRTASLAKSVLQAVIRSHARLTYDRAWAYLENPLGEPTTI